MALQEGDMVETAVMAIYVLARISLAAIGVGLLIVGLTQVMKLGPKASVFDIGASLGGGFLKGFLGEDIGGAIANTLGGAAGVIEGSEGCKWC